MDFSSVSRTPPLDESFSSEYLADQEPAKNSGADPDWFLPIFTRQTWKGSASNENSHRAGYGYYGMTNPGGRPLAPTDP